MKTKFCVRCKKDVDIDLFGKKNSAADGRQEWCRDCKITYNHRWYEANRDRHLEYVGTHKSPRKHLCKHCHKGEPEVTFYIKRVEDRHYRRFICLDCDLIYKKRYPKKVDGVKRERKRNAARLKISRTKAEDRYKHIYRYTKVSDKRNGKENDLDRDFIRELIKDGCKYCGDTAAKMTLDRIDNSKGHVKKNVNPSCMRCNLFRRDLPYEVWLMIVPVMKLARMNGLLDGWKAGTFKGEKSVPTPEDIEMLVGI